MKIHGVKLNWKNFWIPLIIFSLFWYVMWFAGNNDVSSGGYTGSGGNTILDYILIGILTLFSYFPIMLILMSIPSFFMIRRLLSKKPKKIFYVELPIFIALNSISLLSSLIFGISSLRSWKTILSQEIIMIIELSILAISMYFYYKKFVN